MTKKDYIALAKIIKDNTKIIRDYLTTVNGEPKVVGIVLFREQFINQLCGILGSDNPRFNEVMFRDVCNGRTKNE